MTMTKLAVAAALYGATISGSAFAQTTFAGNTNLVLAESVHQAINTRPALAGDQIRVQAYGDTIYLTGQVDTQTEAAQAESIARTIEGVRRVVNTTSVSASGN
jgi:osmotically-inducible protein OsmY